MGLIDAATAPLRYVLHGAEHEAAADLDDLKIHLAAAVHAIRETTAQIEAHAQVLDRLATTLLPMTTAMAEMSTRMPALIDSVESLNSKLDTMSEVLEPLALAGRELAHAEHEVTKIGNLFSRHKTTPPSEES